MVMTPILSSLKSTSWGDQKKLRSLVLRFLLLVGARAIALTFALVCSVWAARMLGPDRMGVSGLVVSILTPLGLLVLMNQDVQLIRTLRDCRTKRERRRLINVVVSFRIIFSTVILLIGLMVLICLDAPFYHYIAILAGGLQLIADANSAYWIFQARDEGEVQVRCNALGLAVATVLTLLFVRTWSVPGYDLLVVSTGSLVASMLAWLHVRHRERCRLAINIKMIPDALELFWRGKWLFITGVMVYAYTSLDQILVPWLASVYELGLYRTALQVNRGVAAFTYLVPVLLYPKLIDSAKAGLDVLWKFQNKVALRLFFLVLPAGVFAVILCVYGYKHVFGAQYNAAAIPCAVLITSKLVGILSGVYVWGQWAIRRDKLMLLVLGGGGCFSMVGNIIAIPKFGIAGAAFVNLSTEIAILVVVILFSRPPQTAEIKFYATR